MCGGRLAYPGQFGRRQSCGGLVSGNLARSTLQHVFADLFDWCRERNFAGYDPFDALNSRLFQATPLKHSRLARLAWTQLLKRSPINLRPLVLVPRERNAKGIALVALAALANYRRWRTTEAETAARALLDDLLAMRLSGAWYPHHRADSFCGARAGGGKPRLQR